MRHKLTRCPTQRYRPHLRMKMRARFLLLRGCLLYVLSTREKRERRGLFFFRERRREEASSGDSLKTMRCGTKIRSTSLASIHGTHTCKPSGTGVPQTTHRSSIAFPFSFFIKRLFIDYIVSYIAHFVK